MGAWNQTLPLTTSTIVTSTEGEHYSICFQINGLAWTYFVLWGMQVFIEEALEVVKSCVDAGRSQNRCDKW